MASHSSSWTIPMIAGRVFPLHPSNPLCLLKALLPCDLSQLGNQ